MALMDWGTMGERDSLSESIPSGPLVGVTLFLSNMTFSSLIYTD